MESRAGHTVHQKREQSKAESRAEEQSRTIEQNRVQSKTKHRVEHSTEVGKAQNRAEWINVKHNKTKQNM